MRSKGSPNPKEAGAQYVAQHVADAGPDGPKLRRKYLHRSVKGTKSKAGGNSGKTGRRYRAYMRGHGGGQIPNEEKTRREAQSRAAVAARQASA